MAEQNKVLGQQSPVANADTTLYTVPSSRQAVVSTLTVCNRAGTEATFRVAVRPGGVSLNDRHYIFYDTPVARNATVAVTIGITLSAGDVVTVRASSTNVSFNLFGVEVS